MSPADMPVTSFSNVVQLLLPVAGIIGLFTMLAVVGFARERRREREALYRHETARKLIEAGQMTFEQFAAFERAEAERPLAARRRSLSITGAVLVLAGSALFAAFTEVSPELAPELREIAVFAFVPIGIGSALLLHALASALSGAMAERFRRKGQDGASRPGP